MAERNRVFFKSVDEAEAAGFKRAGNCPEQVAANRATPATSSNGSSSSSAPVSKPTEIIIRQTPVPAAGVKTTSSSTTVAESKPLAISTSLKIVGNKNSKIFHRPGCSGYDRVSEKNRVYFNSGQEAETAGYRLAKNCSGGDPN